MDFEKLKKGFARYGRILEENPDGTMTYYSYKLDKEKSYETEIMNDGWIDFSDKNGMGAIAKTFPSKENFMEMLLNEEKKIEVEAKLATLCENRDLRF